MAIEFGNIDIRTQVEKVENIIASLEELKLENYHNGARDIMYSETTSDIVLSAIKFFGTSAEISYRRKNVLDSLVRELDSLSSLRGGIYDAIEFSKRKIKNFQTYKKTRFARNTGNCIFRYNGNNSRKYTRIYRYKSYKYRSWTSSKNSKCYARSI